MQPRNEMRPYHPALPTIADTEKQAQAPAFLSDHIPTYYNIPLEAGKNDNIRVLSWNVLEKDWANGFSKPRSQGIYGENEADRKLRHQAIANHLTHILVKAGDNIDIIALQEIHVGSEGLGLLDEIMQRLPKNYKPVITRINDELKVVDFNGCITFYNEESIKPGESMEAMGDLLYHQHLCGSIAYFNHLETGKRINLLNLHARFSQNPGTHEKRIIKFLELKDKDDVTVVVGDFNCTIAPVHTERTNITTSVASTDFRYEKHIPVDERLSQGAHAIDGAFYATSKSFTCRQAETRHVTMNNEGELSFNLDSDPPHLAKMK